MFKKIYLAVLGFITVLCIIGGSLYHIGGWFSGTSLGDLFMTEHHSESEEHSHMVSADISDLSSYTNGSETSRRDSADRSENLTGTDAENTTGNSTAADNTNPSAATASTVTAPEFEKIKIDASVLEVRIEEGQAFHISYDCVDYLTPEITLENKVLTIKQPSVRKLVNNTAQSQMTITVPADTCLKELNIQTDVGDILLSNIYANKAVLLANVGSIEGSDCILDSVDAESDVGEIAFTNSELAAGEISADVGSISLTNCTFTDLEISGDLGDIVLTTPLDLSDFDIELSVDLGSITVNGTSYKKSFRQKYQGSRQLEVENEVGSIDLQYGQ